MALHIIFYQIVLNFPLYLRISKQLLDYLTFPGEHWHSELSTNHIAWMYCAFWLVEILKAVLQCSQTFSLFQIETKSSLLQCWPGMASIWEKNLIHNKLQFQIILIANKKCVTEKKRVQPSKSLSFYGFVVNTP